MIEIALPWPPSLNAYYRTYRGRILLSDKGRKYKLAVQAACADAGIYAARIADRLSVAITLHCPNRRSYDLDNRPKAILDALQGAQVLINDSQVDFLSVERGEIIRGGVAEVVIRTRG